MHPRIAAGVLLVLAAASAVAAPQAEPVRIDRYADLVAFTPTEPGTALTLRVVGPGGYALERALAPDDIAYVDAVGTGGGALPDGVYRYEVRVLRAAGAERGLDARGHRLPSHLAGSFRVQGGSIVDPGAWEGEPK